MHEFAAPNVYQTRSGTARVVESASLVEEALWKKSFSRHCKDHRFYAVLEETLPDQFDYRYVILENARTGERAVQPFFFVAQDLTAGLPKKLRAPVDRIRKRFPRFLKMRILMVGCAAGEGNIGCTEPWAVEALHDFLGAYPRVAGPAIILLKDVPADYRSDLALFPANGYTRVPSMPAATLNLDFTSFEDYMQKKLSRIFRKNLRRKFKAAAAYPLITLEVVTDVSPFVEKIFPLYLQTFHRSQFKFEELNKEFFCQLGRKMPDRVRFFLWRQEGRIIAFSLCMVHDGVLYDVNVGLDYSVAHDLHLYFITWRDIIQWSIENGLKMYHTGPLNYDPKLHLRLKLAPLDLYARHASALLNPFFKIAIRYLQPARHDPILARFPNAKEL
ncbi:MAG: GNAT family N-acetyltransferase [Verrucomicrobiota bacterium]|nr:GNAT family N-acetyltransferase [Verrucomicrobiota bacterium]